METEKTNLSVDIYDLCSILQSVGFALTDDADSQKPKTTGRSIEIVCNVTGRKVYLESNDNDCYCWRHGGHTDVEIWETSGTSGGVQTSKMMPEVLDDFDQFTRLKESSTSNWKDLPKNIMSSVEKTMETLVQMVRGISPVMHTPPREPKNSVTLSNIDAKLDKIKSDCHLNQDDPLSNISRSTFNIHTAADVMQELKVETPNRYRSLDALTELEKEPMLPEPGTLNAKKLKNIMMTRQNTYTTSPTLDLRSTTTADVACGRTSSPVPSVGKSALNKLYEAERLSEDLMSILKETKKLFEDDSRMSPHASVMDVSKISHSKDCEPRRRNSIGHMCTLSARSGQPYASSPNLSRVQESKFRSVSNTSLKRIKSASTNKIHSSNLQTRSEVSKPSSLKRSIPKKLSSMTGISPTFGARKSFGLSSVLSNQVSGTYKPLTDRFSLGGASSLPKEGEVKRKNLYSHIKPTILRTPSAKATKK